MAADQALSAALAKLPTVAYTGSRSERFGAFWRGFRAASRLTKSPSKEQTLEE